LEEILFVSAYVSLTAVWLLMMTGIHELDLRSVS